MMRIVIICQTKQKDTFRFRLRFRFRSARGRRRKRRNKSIPGLWPGRRRRRILDNFMLGGSGGHLLLL